MNDTVNWLVHCPASDSNFQHHLRQATEADLQTALGLLETMPNKKTVIRAVRGRLHRIRKPGARP